MNDRALDAAARFDGLFGHASHLAIRIDAALSACFSALPSWYLAQPVELACQGNFTSNLATLLKAIPNANNLLRDATQSAPDFDLRNSDQDFDSFTDQQQTALCDLILNALFKWTMFRSTGAASLLRNSCQGNEIVKLGEAEFEKLFALHCHLKQSIGVIEQEFLEGICQKWRDAIRGKQTPAQAVFPGPTLMLSLTEFDELMAAGPLLLNVSAFGASQYEPIIQDWFETAHAEALAISSEPERHMILARAALARASVFRWKEPVVPARRVSLAPSSDDATRHATRLIAMVHEMHKAGYQLIRISPGLGGAGFWRCNISAIDNVGEDGFTLIDPDPDSELVAYYSSAEGSKYFGWPDAPTLNARQLAQRFLERFPKIVQRGLGRDWLYAGWLTDVLGRAEQGSKEQIVTLYNYTGAGEIETQELNDWQPPPPRTSSTGN